MITIRILLVMILLMGASLAKSDIPQLREPTLVASEKLRSYFAMVSNAVDGGEVQFQFSHAFISRIPKACAINAHVKVYNAKSTFAPWNQVSAVSFIGLTPNLLSKQNFYVGGLGKNLVIELKYDAQAECSFKGDDIRFEIKGL